MTFKVNWEKTDQAIQIESDTIFGRGSKQGSKSCCLAVQT
jgi:hypothetical protein